MYEQGAAWDKIFMTLKKPYKRNFLTIVTNKDKKIQTSLGHTKNTKKGSQIVSQKKFSTKVAKKIKKN